MTEVWPGQYPICPSLTEVPERLSRAGQKAFPGFSLRVLSRTASTQDLVTRAARHGADPGYCAVALEQSAGRGRQGRTWVGSPGGSLLTSVLVKCPPTHLTAVPLATGLAIHDALAGVGIETSIKWPNDILAGAKLAGVLCEAVPNRDAAVVGIGLNLQPVDGDGVFTAISLQEIARRQVCWQEALELLVPHLQRRWEQAAGGGVANFREDWLKAAAGIGQTITADIAGKSITGVAEGIDDDGSLLVRTAGGVIRLLAAEVHLGPPRH